MRFYSLTDNSGKYRLMHDRREENSNTNNIDKQLKEDTVLNSTIIFPFLDFSQFKLTRNLY